MSPRVTIGMPVRNGAAHIGTALRSLLDQTFRDFRLTISDNCSSDKTEDEVRNAVGGDPRVTYIRQPKNIGAAPNFRFALEQSPPSEFFMWAAHDDRWDPEFIATLVGDLDADPESGVGMTGYQTFSRGLPFWQFHEPFNPLFKTQLVSPEERVIAFSEQKATTHKDNLVYGLWRREALEAVLREWMTYPFAGGVIGGAMCQLALARYKGSFNTRILFFKGYDGIAPGHPLEKPYREAMGIKARLRGAPEPKPFDRDTYVQQIAAVLRGAGLKEEAIAHVVARHE